MKNKNKQKGITLIALVITIIILLILAGISISSIKGSGLFEKTQEAKQKTADAQAKENAMIENYIAQINEMAGEKTLASKVKVGDYVSYKPDTASTDSILTELGTYSGSTANTTSTLLQETSLKWRVLDIENGKVRLISEVPTTSKVTLYGYNGYNNAVYLLDKVCNTLYNKTGYAEKVQNLKIEDVQKYMKITDYSTIYERYGQTYSPVEKCYPSILMQEKEQIVTASDGTTQPEKRLDLSEQINPINQTVFQEASSLTAKCTTWLKVMEESDFTNSKYNELFIQDIGGNCYESYWMSSRSINFTTSDESNGSRAYFNVNVAYKYNNSIMMTGNTLYHTKDKSFESVAALRPVITLNSNVLVKSGNGASTTPYEIGL